MRQFLPVFIILQFQPLTRLMVSLSRVQNDRTWVEICHCSSVASVQFTSFCRNECV